MQVKLILEDDKEYVFNAVPVGYFKKYGQMVKDGDPEQIAEAEAMMILASLKKAHPDVKREDLEFTLLTIENKDSVNAAILKASGLKPGEAAPVAS